MQAAPDEKKQTPGKFPGPGSGGLILTDALHHGFRVRRQVFAPHETPAQGIMPKFVDQHHEHVGFGLFPGQAVGLFDGPVRAQVAGREHDLGAVGAQDALALLRGRCRHGRAAGPIGGEGHLHRTCLQLAHQGLIAAKAR